MNDEESRILRQVDTLLDIAPSRESTKRAMGKTEAMLRAAPGEGLSPAFAPRRSPTRPIGYLVAAAVVVVALLLFLNSGRSVSFAAVQERLRRVRTVTYVSVAKLEGKKVETRWLYSGKRMRRYEHNGDVYVVDPGLGMSMRIQVAKKKVVIRHGESDRDRPPTKSVSERLRGLRQTAVKDLGERKVDGKDAVGFLIPEPGGKVSMKLWVDKRTKLPIRIEASGGRVSKDFAFDVPLSDELFAFTAPEGFRVEHRYKSPQLPIELTKDELTRILALATKRDRTATQAARAFLRLSQGGQDEAARKLAKSNDGEEIRRFHRFQDLTVVSAQGTNQVALAITSKVYYRGEDYSLIFEMESRGDGWVVEDVDIGTDAELRRKLADFQAANPRAKDLPIDARK